MSSDNRILIMYWPRWHHSDPWAAWHASASGEYHEPGNNAQHFATEKEALDWAHKYEENGGYLEYGVQLLSVEEQMEALAYHLKDLSERLDTLIGTGRQFKDPKEEGQDGFGHDLSDSQEN